MKIAYYLYEDKFKEYDSDIIPRVGDMVYINDIFFVESVILYPEHSLIRVNLVERIPEQTKVAESRTPVLKSTDLQRVEKKADESLKESRFLKNQLASLRRYLKTLPQQKAKSNDDSR